MGARHGTSETGATSVKMWQKKEIIKDGMEPISTAAKDRADQCQSAKQCATCMEGGLACLRHIDCSNLSISSVVLILPVLSISRFSFYLSICLFIFLPIYLSIYHLTIHLSIFLSIELSVLSILFIYLIFLFYLSSLHFLSYLSFPSYPSY